MNNNSIQRTPFWFKNAFQIENLEHLKDKCQKHGVDLKHIYKNYENNPNQNLILLDYNQINATSADMFSRTCRGLILNKDDLSVIARPYHRFFNYGEQNTELLIDHVLKNNNENYDVKIYDKLDGSLIKLFYNPLSEQWLIGTRGGVGENPIYSVSIETQLSYTEIFVAILNGMSAHDILEFNLKNENPKQNYQNALNQLQQFAKEENLNKNCTYLFELMTPFNANVVRYNDVKLDLLGINHSWLSNDFNTFDNLKETFTNGNQEDKLKIQLDILQNEIDCGAASFGHDYQFTTNMGKNIGNPVSYNMKTNDIQEVLNITKMLYGYDGEGYVVYINGLPKIKIKSDSYVNIHNMISNNVFTAKNAAQIVFAHEEDEYLAVLPQRKDLLTPYINARNSAKELTQSVYTYTIQYLSQIGVNTELLSDNIDYINEELYHGGGIHKQLTKEQNKSLFTWLSNQSNDVNGKTIEQVIGEEQFNLYNDFIKKHVIELLKGKPYNNIIGGMNPKSQVDYLTTIMTKMGLSAKDYELRNNASKLD